MTATDTTAFARVPFDRAFIDAMVPHHQSAIEMAKAARTSGLSEPELVGIADAIVINQQDEIDHMKQWRKRWFGSARISSTDAAKLGLTAGEMGMQGMQHDPTMLASVADVDAEFARMMIDHHEGAIRMARLGVEKAEHPELLKLARQIMSAQEQEVSVMTKYAQPHSSH